MKVKSEARRRRGILPSIQSHELIKNNELFTEKKKIIKLKEKKRFSKDAAKVASKKIIIAEESLHCSGGGGAAVDSVGKMVSYRLMVNYMLVTNGASF